MSEVAPLGRVYQAGTLSGNPLAVAAGLATIRALARSPASTSGWRRSARGSSAGLREAARKAGVPLTVNRVGSMLTGVLLRGPGAPTTPRRAAPTPSATRASSTAMLERGVYLAPSQFEAAFVSLAHTEADLRRAGPGGGRRPFAASRPETRERELY